MAEIGHNQPPEMAASVAEVTSDLSRWLAENPVILSEEAARAAKQWKDRAYLALQDLDSERKSRVRPLNDQIIAINATYKQPRGLLEKVLGELKVRFRRFIESEETKRIEAAERSRALAEDAERAAREAEQRERLALEGARSGELDVDVASVTQRADAAFTAYQKAERQAQVAERETKVRIGGGFRRAIGLRAQTTLEITDMMILLEDIGYEPIEEAALKAARAFHKLHKRYPRGIKVLIDRRI